MESEPWYQGLLDGLKDYLASVSGTVSFDDGDVSGEVSFGSQGPPWQLVLLGMFVLLIFLARR